MTLAGIAVLRPVTTAMFFIGLAILGAISLDRLPVQIFPELVRPEVFVTVTQQGYSPEQVERELVMPVEREVGKLEGIEAYESFSRQNNGGVRISYAPNTDMKFALLQLESRITRLQPLLPARTRVNIQRFDSSDLSASVMQIHVLGEGDINWLREFAEEKIRPELEAVDGVVNAQVLGGQRTAIEIIVDPLMLQAHQLSMSDVRNRINAFNTRRQYLGRVYDGDQAYAVSIQGQFTDLVQIRRVVIKPELPLHLGDIAKIRYGLQERTDLQRINGKAAVGIRIQKDDEANLIELAGELEDTIERVNGDLAYENIQLVISQNQAEIMNEALNFLKRAAVVGGLLGLFVLFLFLRNLRFVAVLLLAIPCSLLLTFNLMYMWDLSLNVLSMCGLALAVGMLMDNGIVVMENIFKHFEQGKSPKEAAKAGTDEVARAVVAATATTITVFLPVVFIQSDFQDILREFALSIAFPLLASLLVALTLVPALASKTLSLASRPPTGTGALIEMYTVCLKAGLRHRISVSLGIVGALVITLIISFFYMLQQDIRREESRFTVYISMPEGTTIEALDAVVGEIESAVRDLKGIDRFTTSISETQASINVALLPLSERPDQISVDLIKENLEESFGEVQNAIVSYEAIARTGRGGGGRGGGGGGGIRGTRQASGGFNLEGGAPSEMAVIRGYDFTVLQMLADDLVYRLEELEEIDPNSVRADAERGASEVHVLPDEEIMFDRRLQVRQVLNAVSDANPRGARSNISFLTPEGTEIPIDVRNVEDPEEEGEGIAGLRQTPILGTGGTYIPLVEVSHVRRDQGRSMILRTDQSRRVIVSYRFAEEILQSQPLLEASRAYVQAVVSEMVLPEGYSIEMIEAEEETIYYWMMGIAALLIFMILASLFESLSAPVIILCTLPAAIIGSCWALILSGTGLTSQEAPMALLGLIVLSGIAVNNGIVLIDAIETLRRRGFRRERAVLTASRSRVRPVLMTSATTILGMLPLALIFGGDYEIWPPFAIVVIGGLAVSTVSTLVFIPVVYMGIDQTKAWLTDIGWFGIVLGTTAAAGLTYWVDDYYQSLFWTYLLALPAWMLCMGVIWIVQRIYRARMASLAEIGNIEHLEIRNLTKIYGAPGRFKHEWDRFKRRHQRLLERGQVLVDKKAIRDSLWWKLPLLALLIYLETYFEQGAWIFLAGLAIWGLIHHLVLCAAALRDFQIENRWISQIARLILPLVFIAFIHWRLELISLTIATSAIYLLYRIIGFLANRVAKGRVDPEHIPGKLGPVKGIVYRGAAAIPLIGVPRPQFQALGGVSLDIPRGMFGLLGPNGAGKTTLMRIVCRVLSSNYGSVLANGKIPLTHRNMQGVIGYLPQHFGLYLHMSAYNYLEYRALLEGFKDGVARRKRVQECLEQVNLWDRRDDLIGSFSGGMKQRVGIAQTLLHLPQIIVVDEPTAGLDPLERIRFRNLLARFSQEKIIIFSTHIVEDISGSCNRLAVLNHGKLLYTGTPIEMRDLARDKVWEALLPDPRFEALERDLDMITHVRVPDGIRVRFLATDPISEARAVAPTLEDAYLYLLRHGDEYKQSNMA